VSLLRRAGPRRAGRDVSRVFGEPVEVWLRDGKPERFVWRGRLYAVLAVLGEGPQVGGQRDRESWRVEASPARNVPSAIYELARETATGRWLISRAPGPTLR
jgi:Family of unknown function (DUF6504)